MSSFPRLVVGGLLSVSALALSACDTTREAMQARLEVTAPACASNPELTLAQAFPAGSKGQYTQTIRFTEASPCLTDAAGKKVVYGVLALPADGGAGVLTVSSYAMGETVFSPHLQMRDEHGAVTREVGRDSFLYNGAGIEVQLRERPGERYLIIMSDATSVGQSVQQIQSARVSTGAMAGPVYVPINIGSEHSTRLTFAHNGEVTVSITPMPKADGK